METPRLKIALHFSWLGFLLSAASGQPAEKATSFCQPGCPYRQLLSVLLSSQLCGWPRRDSVASAQFPVFMAWLVQGLLLFSIFFLLGSSSLSSSRWRFLSRGVSSDHDGVMANNLFPFKSAGSSRGLFQEISPPSPSNFQA